MENLVRKLRCTKGQGAVEYAMVVLAIVVVVGLVLMATENPIKKAITSSFDKVDQEIQNTPSQN